MYCNSVTLFICKHNIYCFLLCCSLEGFFPFFPCESFFGRVFPDLRSQDWDVVRVQIVTGKDLLCALLTLLRLTQQQ